MQRRQSHARSSDVQWWDQRQWAQTETGEGSSLTSGHTFLPWGWGEHWQRLPRELLESPPLEIFQAIHTWSWARGLSRDIRPHDLHRSFPASAMLCDIVWNGALQHFLRSVVTQKGCGSHSAKKEINCSVSTVERTTMLKICQGSFGVGFRKHLLPVPNLTL